ncbi:6034_t:CDS:2, partial [Racocetra persica]
DNGHEFTAEIIKELLTIWLNVHIINGCLRYPQSQRLVEYTNDVLQQKVSKWMEDTGRKDWSRAVPLCYAINIQISRQTKNSPYVLVFGQNPLHHFTILKKIKEQHINSEDELSENWFEPSEPRDDFDQQEVIESLLGATALNI